MNPLEQNLRNLYSDKTVLVTGHTGFKGTWLLGLLKQMSCRVVGFALDPICTDENHFYTKIPSFHPPIDIRKDIRDFQSVCTVLHTYKPDLIFHLAAQSLVSQGIADPMSTYSTNIMGLVHLLEGIRTLDHVGVVVVTSDKCYAPSSDVHTELSSLGGEEPYSVSKASMEMIVRTYQNDATYKHSIATARAGNVVGGGDFAEHRLIPDWIRAQQNGSSTQFQIRHPTAERPFQYVLEPLMGYVVLGHHLLQQEKIGAWNFGPQQSLQVQQIISLCEEIQQQKNNRNKEKITFSFPFDFNNWSLREQKNLSIDSSKAKSQLGWYTRCTPYDMIKWTFEGYEVLGKNPPKTKYNNQHHAIQDVFFSQIQNYWKLYFGMS